MQIVNYIFDLFSVQGGNAYIGEPITQLDHAIQAGLAARRHHARPELVTAALLHDIGHFLHDYAEDCADHAIDSQHEKVAARFLRQYFKDEVAELVLHHVNAKRYLTATHEKYSQNLTEASRKSLQLQGGPMDAAEIACFASHPLFDDILLVRYWDEAAKVENKIVPPITDFAAELKASLLPQKVFTPA